MRLALFLPTLHVGGAERVTLTIASGLLKRGHGVDLVLCRAEGGYLEQVPEGARVVDLGASRTATSLVPLARYLRRARPVALLSTMNHVNVVALAAAMLARAGTRVVVSEASSVHGQLRDSPHRRARLLPRLIRMLYPRSSAVVAVCEAVATELVQQTGLPADLVRVVYNPIDFDHLCTRAEEPPAHPWLQDAARTVVLAAGRLSPEKGFDVLLQAMTRVPGAHLVILGEGEERARLERSIAELHLDGRVALPGFDRNPYAAMKRCAVFALPSRWEGLPTALIEALYLGARCVASSSAGGAREILEDGRWGALVPPEDPEALARALRESLSRPPPKVDTAWIDRFEVTRVVDRYLRIIEGA